MVYPTASIERHLRQQLGSDLSRRRFDRAKQFVESTLAGATDEALAHRMNARWLKFLCGRAPVHQDIWPEVSEVLGRFVAAVALPPDASRRFVGLSLMGWLWRAWCLEALSQGPGEVIARLTRVAGWERFEGCRQEGAGLILLPVHGQFVRLSQAYFRHRGHEGFELGVTGDKLDTKGLTTPAAKQVELARQMQAAKQILSRGGVVLNMPDARQNLGNARPVELFGRKRPLATGFAELALMTGARMLPMAYRFTPRGSFVLEFGAALRDPGTQGAHDARIESLLGQYASFLRDEWRHHPWNIPWPHLKHYCELPAIDRDALGRSAQVPS